MSEVQPINKPLQGIGGWLLLFIVLGFFNALRTILTEYKDVTDLINELPQLKTAMYTLLALEYIWIGAYCYGLFRLVSIEKNAINYIKLILKIAPVVAIVTPLISLLSMQLFFPDAIILTESAIGEIYDAQTISGIVGVGISSLIWHKYFSVSVRVKNTWNTEEGFSLALAGSSQQQPQSIFTSLASLAGKIITPILFFGFIIMGIVQIMATYDFFYRHWDWHWLLAGFASFILGYFPLVGSICGVLGAINAWYWDVLPAVLLFFWWPVLWLVATFIGGGAYVTSKLFTNFKRGGSE